MHIVGEEETVELRNCRNGRNDCDNVIIIYIVSYDIRGMLRVLALLGLYQVVFVFSLKHENVGLYKYYTILNA